MIWTTLPRSEPDGGLSCHVAGRGAPVVLLHGVGLRAEAWGATVPALARNYRVHAFDLPGHGQSAALDTQSPDLIAFTDRIAAGIARIAAPVRLAGHSMGAMIALDLAVRYPELCAGVAALNAVYRRSDAAQSAVLARASDLAQGGTHDPSAPLLRWFGAHPTGAMADAADACRDWLNGADPAGYAAAYRVFAMSDAPSDSALAAMTCPALFLTGAEEPNSTPAMSQSMAALVPDGRAVILDGAAHMMPMTHPKAVNSALMSFFERCGGSDGTA